MKRNRTRTLYAIVLLSAILPILAASSFHHHDAPKADQACEACEQGLPHPGHMDTRPDGTDCPLCRFLATLFLPSLPEISLCLSCLPVLLGGPAPRQREGLRQEVRAIRAPPAPLCLK
ncbi:MAG: hypothetical protein K5910_05770 [Bacteroidales bacterium]|nr:hypothetical protein [Bacteroidales bacterium]